MVPPPSVVVVVVVVLEVCPQANGATTASAMLSRVFFIVILPLVFPRAGRTLPPSLETGPTSLPINIFRIGTEDWLCRHFVSRKFSTDGAMHAQRRKCLETPYAA